LVWLLVAGLALVLAAFVIVVVWVRKRRATKLLIKNGPAGHGCAGERARTTCSLRRFRCLLGHAPRRPAGGRGCELS